jgi:hypothetical protein
MENVVMIILVFIEIGPSTENILMFSLFSDELINGY